MMRTVTRLVLALAVLSAALAAGFFYAYACSVMIGLSAADPAAAIKAMQGINATVRNPAFAFAFFGPLAFGGGAALGAALRQEKGRRQTLLIASSVLLHAVGVLGVTFGFNVPLNQTMATVQPTSDTAAATWRVYTEPWASWKAVRTLAAIGAFTLFTAALVREWRRTETST